ncbi:MAG: LysM peptidoglycan-binding domain-containing protein [Pseudomonadota bacterium]
MLRRVFTLAALSGVGLFIALFATGRLDLVTDLVWRPGPSDPPVIEEIVLTPPPGASVPETTSETTSATAPIEAADGVSTTAPGSDASAAEAETATAAPEAEDAAPENTVAAVDPATEGAPTDTQTAQTRGATGGGEAVEEIAAADAAEQQIAETVIEAEAEPAPDEETTGLAPADKASAADALGETGSELESPVAALAPSETAPTPAPGVGPSAPAGPPQSGAPVEPDLTSATEGTGIDSAIADTSAAGPPPRFDIVRVAPDGMAVIAGQAAPRTRVELLVDGETMTAAETDESGNFAIIADLGSIEAPRALQLRVPAFDEIEGGTTSAIRVATIAPPTGTDATQNLITPEVVASAESDDEAPEGAPRPDAPNAQAAALSAPVVLLPSVAADTEAEAPPEGPKAVRAGTDAVSLVAPSAPTVPRLLLDTVSYTENGKGIVIGRAPPGARVRAWVNNRPAAETRAGDGGGWQIEIPPSLLRAAEVLRFEHIEDDGTVAYRLETGFDYEPGGATFDVEERTITVERGDSLWRLAENIYGVGWRYSVIFAANDNLIRDPDLIYPSQEFVVPELVEGVAPDGTRAPEEAPLR